MRPDVSVGLNRHDATTLRGILAALVSTETSPEPWVRRVIEEELVALRHDAGQELPELAELGAGDLLAQVQERMSTAQQERALRFWRRVGWLLQPLEREAISQLDPVGDCEQIFHFVAREFRTELKVFAVLHEMRAAVSLPLANFFLNTGEFSERGVKRIVDTVLMVCNVLEWGVDSARGRYCIERINGIHARYSIPNSAFKFVLLGIMFIPWEFNQRFGWRAMTDVERLGWFHAFVKLGRAMNINELNDDFDEMYRWYRDVSDANARFAANKHRLVVDILGQVLARYPAAVRGVIASAFVAGMDDAYLTAAALPRAPSDVESGLRRLFQQVGQAAQQTPLRGYWLQSLLTSSVYPEGYELGALGVGQRSAHLPNPILSENRKALPLTPDANDQGALEAQRALPLMTRAELDQRLARGDLLLILNGYVYDLTRFAALHPGGRAVLDRHNGTDASAAFNAAPHSVATKIFSENYRVARWVEAVDAAQRAESTAATLPLATAVDSTQHLAQRRSLQTPVPDSAESLLDWCRALLPLVNARSKETLSVDDIAAQVRGVVA